MPDGHEERDKYAELFRRVTTTCKSRYNASRRLQWQHTLSQWTIAFLSLTLIIVPVVELADLSVSFPPDYVQVMQIIFAALVLVYSLLIGTENFSRRAEKLHRCGLELGRLTRELKPYKDGEIDGTIVNDNYNELQNKYYDTLEKYENHVTVDYLFSKLDMSDRYYSGYFDYWSEYIYTWALYLLAFSAHFLVIGFVLIWVLFFFGVF